MELLRLLFILLALLIILFQKVDVRVTRYDRLTVKINFALFAIVLTDEYPPKSIRFRAIKLKHKFKAIFRSAKYLLSKSEVIISPIDDGDKQKPIIDLSFHFSLFHMIISAMILLYYTIESKIKRMMKNV